MQQVINNNNPKTLRSILIFISGLASFFLVQFFGLKAFYLIIAMLAGLVITPFVYNKTGFLLLMSVVIYPLSRILSDDDKLVTTAVLYLLALPNSVWLINKYFLKEAKENIHLWSMLAYLSVAGLNFLILGAEPGEMIREIGRVYFAIFITLGVYDFVKQDRENISRAIKFISYSMNLLAFIAVTQFITKQGGIFIEGFYRLRATFTNSNDYGFILSVFICFAFCMYLISEKNKEKLYWFITIAINSMVLFATFSKTSIANTALALFVISMFLPIRKKILLIGSTALLGLSSIAFLMFSGTFHLLVLRFMDIASFEWRLGIWRQLSHMISQGNIFIGQGINASREFMEFIVPAGTSVAPHNLYLETIYNLGIIGLIAFISIFIALTIKGISMFKTSNDIFKDKVVSISLISITLIAIIQNVLSNAFLDRAGNIIFWAIVAVLVCLYNQNKEGKEQQTEKSAKVI